MAERLRLFHKNRQTNGGGERESEPRPPLLMNVDSQMQQNPVEFLEQPQGVHIFYSLFQIPMPKNKNEAKST